MDLLDSSMDKISDKVYNKIEIKNTGTYLGKDGCGCKPAFEFTLFPLNWNIFSPQVIKALSYLKKELKIIHRGNF